MYYILCTMYAVFSRAPTAPQQTEQVFILTLVLLYVHPLCVWQWNGDGVVEDGEAC